VSVTYRSFCSGIEAATVAWHPLGWRCLSVSEIDDAACSVLAHHYPHVPNVGNMETCLRGKDVAHADLFVAGTPCQSFSVAGLREGLRDPRGNLALVYLGLVDRHRPKWVVWENVPGVLSSGSGRDFGAFLGALGKLGYGWAYRVLDAQYIRVESHARAVPQRRRRVFVVGHLGSWQRAAAVLLERESLCGHPAPSRKAGQGFAGTLGGGAAGRGWSDDTERMTFIADDVAGTLSPGAHPGGANGQDAHTNMLVPSVTSAMTSKWAKGSGGPSGDECQNLVAHALTHTATVRRLTPRECERLQGFPDDYTLVPHSKKLTSDAARYRMLGNSMAVNVMRFIGERIALVETIS